MPKTSERQANPHLLAQASTTLVGLLVALIVSGANPAAAFGQEEDRCEARVSANQSRSAAAFVVECNFEISRVVVDANESGDVEGDAGAECFPTGISAECSPEAGRRRLEGRFVAHDENVCNEPPLSITFIADEERDEPLPPDVYGFEPSDVVGPVGVDDCEDDAEAGGSGEPDAEEDDGRVPVGGVDSGVGRLASIGAQHPSSSWLLTRGW